MTRIRTCAALAATAVFGLTACGGGSETALEKAIEAGGGGDVDVEIGEDGGIDIETEDGSFSSGGFVKFPDDFPSEVPVPGDGATLLSSIKDTNNWFLTYQVEGITEDYCSDYAERLTDAGFSEDSVYSVSGGVGGTYVSDEFTVNITCGEVFTGIVLQVERNQG
jgi:hypothetical protein